MKRLAFFLLSSGLFWTGCIGNDSLGTATAAQKNVQNLARISIGMTSDQVFQIMRQPYSNETFDFGDDHYEVWFYITNLTLLDQKKLTHANLTPLTFKNSILQGKGYAHYEALLAEDKPAVLPEPKEDKDLEKALTPPPGPVKPTKPVPPPPSTTPPTKPKTPPKTPAKSPAAPGPTQPKAVQPPPPTQPGSQPATPQKSTPQNKVSMTKKPANPPPETQTTPPAQVPKKSNKSPPPSTESKNKVPLTQEDKQMIDQEQEENFDFW